jgi:hypothetical protein
MEFSIQNVLVGSLTDCNNIECMHIAVIIIKAEVSVLAICEKG